jgi:DNA-directed RNA polymerase subunit RPC12/RpoP
MVANFNCPNCGALLDYVGNEANMRCPYCDSMVVVPEEVYRAGQEADVAQSMKKIAPWVKVFLIVIIASIVIPTCIGIIATLIGIVAGVGTPLLVIILSLFGQH